MRCWRPTALIILGFLPPTAAAAYRITYESAEPSWRLRQHDCQARIRAQSREFSQAHSGQGCEYIRYTSDLGTRIHFAQRIDRARLIDELNPTLWVRASRPGIQLMARVVLPRSINPQTGKPLTTFIKGTFYTTVGRWQRLTIKDALRKVQIAPLRSQHPHINVRTEQAYVDYIVLNGYTGRGTTELRIDDLEVNIPVIHRASEAELLPVEAGAKGAGRRLPMTATQPTPAQLRGQLLMVGGRPFMAKVVEYNGEDFRELQTLGFNTIHLKSPPTLAQQQQAESLGLWLIAPPGADARRILAWTMGSDLTAASWNEVANQVAKLRQRAVAGPVIPIVGGAREDLQKYGRLLDILQFDVAPIGTSIDLRQLATRWQRKRRLARPGAPFWAGIQTEIAPHAIRQLQAMSGLTRVDTYVGPEQLQLMVFSAIQAGARAIYFHSSRPLNGSDLPTQIRRAALELVNHRLDLIEPWVAGGHVVGPVQSEDNESKVVGWRTDRARLLIATRVPPHQQFSASPSEDKPVSFAIRDAPLSEMAFALTVGGLKPIRSPKGQGVRVEFPSRRPVALAVVTQDRLTRDFLTRKIPAKAERIVALEHQLVRLEAGVIDEALRQLRQSSGVDDALHRHLQQAQTMVRQSQRLIDDKEHQTAWLAIERSRQHLQFVKRSTWQTAATGFPDPTASPLCIAFNTVPLHWRLVAQRSKSGFGGNALVGGDMEDLARLTQSGWNQWQTSDPRWKSRTELSLRDPRTGRRSLRMDCVSSDPKNKGREVPKAPLVVESAPVKVKAGDLIRIQGWVRIDQPITGCPDGLMIRDSLGSEALALRITSTRGWRPFVMYRAAPRDQTVRVSFSLTGVGEVFLDDVTISMAE